MEEELIKQIENSLKEICVFPGPKSEFEDFIGYKTSWVDLGGRIKGLAFYGKIPPECSLNPFFLYKPKFQKKIMDSGIVALVNSSPIDKNLYFGVPVKRKKSFFFGLINPARPQQKAQR